MSAPDRDFTLRQLRTFVCTARANGFGRAAEELGISQPAVSSQIQMLEERAGCRLFLRRPGTTPVLTGEGLRFLAQAELMLTASQDMRPLPERSEKRRVRLSVGPRLRERYLKPVMPMLYAEHPDIELEFVPVMPISEIQQAFDQRKIDLLFYTVSESRDELSHACKIADVPIAMVGPPGMAARFDAGVVALNELQFILPAPEHRSTHWAEGRIRELGCVLQRPIMFLDFPDVIQTMVEQGQGVSILMLEQVEAGLAAGRLEIFGPALRPMRRILARIPMASDAARTVERYLLNVAGR